MKHKWDIGKTGLTKHCIITTGGPVTINPRRQPVHIEDKINEMLQDNTTEDNLEKKNRIPSVSI